MLVDSNEEVIEVGEKEKINIVLSELEEEEWYSDIIYYLKNLKCLDHLVNHKRSSLRLKAMKYFLTQDGLGWRNPNGVILKCVNKEEADKLIVELHLGYYGGHFSTHNIAHKIMRAGYYWHTVFSNMH